MMKLILDALLWFFACFGIIQLIKLSFLSFKKSTLCENYLIVVKVINKQDAIEGILRSIVWDNLKKGGVPPILVVDMGSTDDTPMILQRLAREYSFIHVTDINGYKDYFQGDN